MAKSVLQKIWFPSSAATHSVQQGEHLGTQPFSCIAVQPAALHLRVEKSHELHLKTLSLKLIPDSMLHVRFFFFFSSHRNFRHGQSTSHNYFALHDFRCCYMNPDRRFNRCVTPLHPPVHLSNYPMDLPVQPSPHAQVSHRSPVLLLLPPLAANHQTHTVFFNSPATL